MSVRGPYVRSRLVRCWVADESVLVDEPDELVARAAINETGEQLGRAALIDRAADLQKVGGLVTDWWNCVADQEANADQRPSASTTASAKASGASCGTL